jgi:hypothetical protein
MAPGLYLHAFPFHSERFIMNKNITHLQLFVEIAVTLSFFRLILPLQFTRDFSGKYSCLRIAT